ncbi:MAG: hypothetical protein ACK559_13440, partial [bacterium]
MSRIGQVLLGLLIAVERFLDQQAEPRSIGAIGHGLPIVPGFNPVLDPLTRLQPQTSQIPFPGSFELARRKLRFQQRQIGERGS